MASWGNSEVTILDIVLAGVVSGLLGLVSSVVTDVLFGWGWISVPVWLSVLLFFALLKGWPIFALGFLSMVGTALGNGLMLWLFESVWTLPHEVIGWLMFCSTIVFYLLTLTACGYIWSCRHTLVRRVQSPFMRP